MIYLNTDTSNNLEDSGHLSHNNQLGKCHTDGLEIEPYKDTGL